MELLCGRGEAPEGGVSVFMEHGRTDRETRDSRCLLIVCDRMSCAGGLVREELLVAGPAVWSMSRLLALSKTCGERYCASWLASIALLSLKKEDPAENTVQKREELAGQICTSFLLDKPRRWKVRKEGNTVKRRPLHSVL